jgi:hypothetical protein
VELVLGLDRGLMADSLCIRYRICPREWQRDLKRIEEENPIQHDPSWTTRTTRSTTCQW